MRGATPRGGVWGLGAALLAASIVLGLAYPNREIYDAAMLSSPAYRETVRASDQAFLTGRQSWIGFDWASYYAMASPAQSDSYLARRAPFAFRILGPELARGLSGQVGLLDGFQLLAMLGFVGAVIAVYRIFVTLGYPAGTAGLAAALFAFVPKAANPLRHALIIDAGAWALMLWAWCAWLSRRALLSAALLGAAVLWRETSLLLLPCIVHHAWREHVPWRKAALVGGAAAVALLVPRVLVEPLLDLPLRSVMAGTLRLRAGELRDLHGVVVLTLESTAYGLGLGSFLLPIAWRSLFRSPAVYSLWLLVGFGAVVMLLSYEVGRLLVPASLAVLSVVVDYLSSAPERTRVLMWTVLLAGNLAVTAAWCFGRSPAMAVGISLVAMAAIWARDGLSWSRGS